MATSLKGLQKIRVVPNKNYKPSGIKSYVYLLQKYGFDPSMPGPYVHVNKVTQAGLLSKFTKKVGGNAQQHKVLAKKKHHPTGTTTTPGNGTTPETGETGEISAEDVQNDSMYLCEVAIGTPAKNFLLDFDTGSSDLWLWSTELPKSITAKATGHTLFDPTASSSFKNTSGSSWKISYGDSSSASGTVGTDNVTIGGLTIKAQSIELAKTLSAQFEQGTGDGLLGLAWGSINTVTPTPVKTPVDNMIAQDEIPSSAELFTAYLGSWRDADEADKGESFYTFGYIDQPTVAKSGQEVYYTPVDNSEGFWMFNSASASVNGKAIAQTGNTAIADTGTTLALVADATCSAIYAAIPGATFDQTQQGWIYPSTVTVDQLPVVEFAVGDKLFAVQKEDLGFADAGNGMIYGGIQSRGSMTFDILGDTFLKSIYAIFDVGNTQFGAVPRIIASQNISAPPS